MSAAGGVVAGAGRALSSRFVKILPLVALTAALIAPLPATATAAAASAYPVKHPKLIANPLYEAGVLPATTCTEPPVKRHDRALVRDYIDAVIACLETTWEQHLTNAGLPYEPVKVRHMSRIPKGWCGSNVTDKGSHAWYCPKNRTVAFQVGNGYWVEDPSSLWLLFMTASMYGYHVQQLTGITDALGVIPRPTKAESREQSRRYTLQSGCLATAFMKSVWPMEGRSTKDWSYFVTLVAGDSDGKHSWWGKTSTVRAWIKRGFATGDPGSCNTWSTSSSTVA